MVNSSLRGRSSDQTYAFAVQRPVRLNRDRTKGQAGPCVRFGFHDRCGRCQRSLCVAAAVAFLTPVSTPANMMVMGPAGYRFGDYWKLGLPLVLLFGVVSVFLVPLVCRF